MNVRIEKLEALLGRVQSRRAEARPVKISASEAMDLDSLDVDTSEFDEPDLDTSDFDGPQLDSPDLDEPTSLTDEGEALDPGDDLEPISGQVSHESLDAAMREAEDQPPLTPPPESGEEIARPVFPKGEGPTVEQLGETIHLEEGRPTEVELDEPDYTEEPTVQLNLAAIEALRGQAVSSRGPASENLEARLPSSRPDEDFTLPENAREELKRLTLGEPPPIEAQVSKRPIVTASSVEVVSAARSFAPKTFLELLDASLGLK